jgi:hypothetical protein
MKHKRTHKKRLRGGATPTYVYVSPKRSPRMSPQYMKEYETVEEEIYTGPYVDVPGKPGTYRPLYTMEEWRMMRNRRQSPKRRSPSRKSPSRKSPSRKSPSRKEGANMRDYGFGFD